MNPLSEVFNRHELTGPFPLNADFGCCVDVMLRSQDRKDAGMHALPRSLHSQSLDII
jgi:hypothetical protein